jgi:hypothetical protein
MSNIELQESIIRSIQQMTLVQQLRLLDFINSMLKIKREGEPKGLLKFVGAFEKEDLQEMEQALEDCEQIDENEW